MIDTMLDNPAVIAVVNHSRWSVTENITRANKTALLQQLIWEEAVVRREHNLMAFRRGMKVLGIVELLQQYPNLTRPLLVAEKSVLSSQQFLSLIDAVKPECPDECLAYERFMEFIAYIETGTGKCNGGLCVGVCINGIYM